MVRLSTHFLLSEFVPEGIAPEDVPTEVRHHLTILCATILQPLREAMGLPLVIHSGWRPPKRNAAAGGVATSDHQTGRAADFHVDASLTAPWEDNTFAGFHWIRMNRLGMFGQLIIEDHRIALQSPGKLWVHVSIPTPRHPGTQADVNRLLVSTAPQKYEPFTEENFA